MNPNFVLKPTRTATAPSKEPCGNPIRKIKIKEIMFSVVNSNILKKDCFYKFNFW